MRRIRNEMFIVSVCVFESSATYTPGTDIDHFGLRLKHAFRSTMLRGVGAFKTLNVHEMILCFFVFFLPWTLLDLISLMSLFQFALSPR